MGEKKISLSTAILLFIIFILIPVILGVVIFFMNYERDNESSATAKKQNETEINNIYQEEHTSKESKMSVYELVSDANYYNDIIAGLFIYYPSKYDMESDEVVLDYSNPKTVSTTDRKYPYININSNDAKAVNKEIEEMCQEYKERFKEASDYLSQGQKENLEFGWSGSIEYIYKDIVNVKCDYEAYKSNNLLSVVMTEKDFSYSEEPYVPTYKSWVFDLETLEQISFKVAYQRLGYTATEIREKLEKEVKEKIEYCYADYDDERKSNMDMDLIYTMKRYDESIEDNTLQFFVDDFGSLNIILSTAVPFGSKQYNYVYTIK